MRTVALELPLGIQVAVLPVEAQDQAHGRRLLAEAVDEAAAEDAGRVRLAQRVDHAVVPERVVAGERDDGLDAQRVDLRVPAATEALAELRRDDAVRAVGQDRDAGPDLLGRPVVGLAAAMGVQAHLAEPDPHDAVALQRERARRVAVVDLDAQALRLGGHEVHEPRERERDVARVVHLRRHGKVGELDRPPADQEVHLVALDRNDMLHELALVAPAREELVEAGRLERRTRQGVVAGTRRLVDHGDRRVAAGGRELLLQPDRGGEARRAAADDQDVDRCGHARPSVARTSSGTTVSMSPTTPKSA